jgi:hypothetical protein
MRYLAHLFLRLHSRSWYGSKTCLVTHHCTRRESYEHIIHRFASNSGRRQRTNFFHFRWIKAGHFGNLNHPSLDHFHHHSWLHHFHHQILSLNLEYYQHQNQNH